MIPAGYMLKTVKKPDGWVSEAEVIDLYSLSECVSDTFANSFETWKHNGFWLYDSVAVIREVVLEQEIATSDFKLFYYEVHEDQFDDGDARWSAVMPDEAWPVQVVLPTAKTLQGYDVTTHFVGVRPECSPLACNDMASELVVNEHCLFATFDDAFAALEGDRFKDCESGPYRIFAVYTVDENVP